MVIRRIDKGCRQRWKLRILNSSRRIPNSSRRMVKFSNMVQNSRRRPLKSAGNRESYKH